MRKNIFLTVIAAILAGVALTLIVKEGETRAEPMQEAKGDPKTDAKTDPKSDPKADVKGDAKSEPKIIVKNDGKRMKIDMKWFEFKLNPGQDTLYNNYSEGDETMNFYSDGKAEAKIKVLADDDYDFFVKASCDPALNERAKFKIYVDDQLFGKETLLTEDGDKEYKVTGKMKMGDRKLSVEFTNDAYKEGEYDRNLFIHELAVNKAVADKEAVKEKEKEKEKK